MRSWSHFDAGDGQRWKPARAAAPWNRDQGTIPTAAKSSAKPKSEKPMIQASPEAVVENSSVIEVPVGFNRGQANFGERMRVFCVLSEDKSNWLFPFAKTILQSCQRGCCHGLPEYDLVQNVQEAMRAAGGSHWEDMHGMVMEVETGPLAGLCALGAGSNKGKRERAVRLALAASCCALDPEGHPIMDPTSCGAYPGLVARAKQLLNDQLQAAPVQARPWSPLRRPRSRSRSRGREHEAEEHGPSQPHATADEYQAVEEQGVPMKVEAKVEEEEAEQEAAIEAEKAEEPAEDPRRPHIQAVEQPRRPLIVPVSALPQQGRPLIVPVAAVPQQGRQVVQPEPQQRRQVMQPEPQKRRRQPPSPPTPEEQRQKLQEQTPSQPSYRVVVKGLSRQDTPASLKGFFERKLRSHFKACIAVELYNEDAKGAVVTFDNPRSWAAAMQQGKEQKIDNYSITVEALPLKGIGRTTTASNAESPVETKTKAASSSPTQPMAVTASLILPPKKNLPRPQLSLGKKLLAPKSFAKGLSAPSIATKRPVPSKKVT